MRPSLRFALAALAVVALLAGARTSRGTTFYWNTSSGTYSNGASWSPSGGPPSTGDDVRFIHYGGSTNENVIFDRNEATGFVTVGQGTHVTLNLNGSTWTTTNTTSTSSYIGSSSGTNLVTVAGGGLWDLGNHHLFIGDGNTLGALTINSGAVVRALQVKVSFQASTSVPSTLWVKSGAAYEIMSTGNGDLGKAGNPAARITGAGTLRAGNSTNWQLNDYGVIAPGDAGTGTLTLQDGAVYMKSGAKLEMEIGGTNAGAFDQLVLQKVAALGYHYMSFDAGSKLELNFLPSYTATGTNYLNLVVGGKNQLANWANLTNNISFSPLSNTNFSFSLNRINLDATRDALQLTAISLIPEPSTLAGAAAGLVLLALVRRRRA